MRASYCITFSLADKGPPRGCCPATEAEKVRKEQPLGDNASLEAGLSQGNHHSGQKVCRARKMFKGSLASEMSEENGEDWVEGEGRLG